MQSRPGTPGQIIHAGQAKPGTSGRPYLLGQDGKAGLAGQVRHDISDRPGRP